MVIWRAVWVGVTRAQFLSRKHRRDSGDSGSGMWWKNDRDYVGRQTFLVRLQISNQGGPDV